MISSDDLDPSDDMESGTSMKYLRYTKLSNYLYLRLKRASKYWDNQWDDIICEMTEHLKSVNRETVTFEEGPDEAVGADDPYVILTVGLEVRLFKWQHGSVETVDEGARGELSTRGALKELSPGKVLRPCEEKKDREEIEGFLVIAARQREAIKARIEGECGGEKKCEGEREWW